MNSIFKHGPSPQHRIILALLCSTLFIFFDHKMNTFEVSKGYLQSLVSPLQYIATTPKLLMNWASTNITTHARLIEENQAYKINELRFKEELMQLDNVKQENNRLRLLLSSPLRSNMKKMVAEVISVNSDPYTHQIVINRGTQDGVYEGQPVLDDQGIVGQIISVGTITSRVILITDVKHAVPVRVRRNGVRLIASGMGDIDQLEHNFVSHSIDIRMGDILVTSGLGGKYPEGYPVSQINYVSKNESQAFITLRSKPVANIDRIRYLLLLWSNKTNDIFSPTPDKTISGISNTEAPKTKSSKVKSQGSVKKGKNDAGA